MIATIKIKIPSEDKLEAFYELQKIVRELDHKYDNVLNSFLLDEDVTSFARGEGNPPGYDLERMKDFEDKELQEKT